MTVTLTKTKEIKELLSFAFAVGELVEGLAGGVGFDDVAKAVKAARLAGPALRDAKEALDEYLGLDDEAAAELEAWAVASFDLKNDQVEGFIESGLKLAIQLRGLVALLFPKSSVVA